MNTVLIKTLELIYKAMSGKEAYDVMVLGATALMDEDLTNDEKRDLVKAAVMPIIRELGKAWLSVIIAFIVKSVQLKMEKENATVQNTRIMV